MWPEEKEYQAEVKTDHKSKVGADKSVWVRCLLQLLIKVFH